MDGGNLVLSDDLIDGEQEAQKCLVLSNGHMILNGLCNFEITEMLVYSSNIDSNLDFFLNSMEMPELLQLFASNPLNLSAVIKAISHKSDVS